MKNLSSLLTLAATCLLFAAVVNHFQPGKEVIVAQVAVQPASADQDDLQLADDTLAGKEPRFDETLVDSRPLDGWQVNKSAAVVRLDSPPVDLEVTRNFLIGISRHTIEIWYQVVCLLMEMVCF